MVLLKKNRLNLYDIKPQNVLSKDVESLSSYLARLARAHVIDIKRLILELRNVYRVEKGLHRTVSSNNLLGLNSVNKANRSLVLGLYKCTGNKNVKYLSLFALDNIINYSYVVKKSVFWCPHCLYFKRLNNNTIYVKLIWQMNIVMYCEKHNTCLENQCPSCSNTMDFFYKVGYCNHCNSFLGHINVTREKKLPYEYWINDQIGNLFENLERLNDVSYCAFLKSVYPISTEKRYSRFQRFHRWEFPPTVRGELRVSNFTNDFRRFYSRDLPIALTYFYGLPPKIYPTIGKLLQYSYVSGSKISRLLLGEVSYDDWSNFKERRVPTALNLKLKERESWRTQRK